MSNSGNANSPHGRLRARLRMLAAMVRGSSAGAGQKATGEGRRTIVPPPLVPTIEHMLELSRRDPRR